MDDFPKEKTSHTGNTGKPVSSDLNVADYAMNYAKILHSFFRDTIPDNKFWDSDDAARYFAELVTDVLNAQASTSDHAKLANHLYEVNGSKDSKQAIKRMATDTPFASIAHKISEVNHKHGPGWGAWLAGLLIPVVAPLGAFFGQSEAQTPAPEPIAVVLTEEAPARDVLPIPVRVDIGLGNEASKSITYETTTVDVSTSGTPAPASRPAPMAANAGTPISVTYDTADGGHSLTITGPQGDVEVITNILRNFSPAEFDKLSPEQQHTLAQRVFVEMGKIHSQQAVEPASARITLAASPH